MMHNYKTNKANVHFYSMFLFKSTEIIAEIPQMSC